MIAMTAAFAASCGVGITFAQTNNANPQKVETDDAGGMMPGEMMSRMPYGMMNRMPMGPMQGYMMKVMFAVADTDGDGALSFEEVTTIHKRIFDKVDANKDGKVTPEEMQAFMRNQ
jgi:hypothetical protein